MSQYDGDVAGQIRNILDSLYDLDEAHALLRLEFRDLFNRFAPRRGFAFFAPETMSHDQFLAYMTEMHPSITPEHARALFDVCDADRNGCISRDEFCLFRMTMMHFNHSNQMHRELLGNYNGTINDILSRPSQLPPPPLPTPPPPPPQPLPSPIALVDLRAIGDAHMRAETLRLTRLMFRGLLETSGAESGAQSVVLFRINPTIAAELSTLGFPTPDGVLSAQDFDTGMVNLLGNTVANNPRIQQRANSFFRSEWARLEELYLASGRALHERGSTLVERQEDMDLMRPFSIEPPVHGMMRSISTLTDEEARFMPYAASGGDEYTRPMMRDVGPFSAAIPPETLFRPDARSFTMSALCFEGAYPFTVHVGLGGAETWLNSHSLNVELLARADDFIRYDRECQSIIFADVQSNLKNGIRVLAAVPGSPRVGTPTGSSRGGSPRVNSQPVLRTPLEEDTSIVAARVLHEIPDGRLTALPHTDYPPDPSAYAVFGGGAGQENRQRFRFREYDYGINFRRFFDLHRAISPEFLATHELATGESNRCFFIHLGVAAGIDPFLLEAAFRARAAKLLAQKRAEIAAGVEDEARASLLARDIIWLSDLFKRHECIDQVTLLLLWPRELNHIRVMVIPLEPDGTTRSVHVYTPAQVNSPHNFDAAGRWIGRDVILRLRDSHFTILEPLNRAQHTPITSILALVPHSTVGESGPLMEAHDWTMYDGGFSIIDELQAGAGGAGVYEGFGEGEGGGGGAGMGGGGGGGGGGCIIA